MKRLLIVGLLLVACKMPELTPVERGEVAPPEPFLSWPNQQWADEALAVVRAEGLAAVHVKDAKDFCPNGLTERNWVHLLAAMVKYESGFKPDTSYKECSKSKGTYGSSGKWFDAHKAYCIPGDPRDEGVAISRGLIQISIRSGNAYGCGLESPQELHDSATNLACAGKILKRWTAQDGVVAGGASGAWRGGARYWSVLRSTGRLADVKRTLKPFCE
jgi:hypothetical protein